MTPRPYSLRRTIVKPAHIHSEHAELLLRALALVGRVLDRQDVEADGLGQGPCLTDGDNVTLVDLEAGRNVGRDVLVSLLETFVLGHIVHVIPSHDDAALHLGRHAHTLQNAATDRNIARERALLVNVHTLRSRLGGLEAQADVLGPSDDTAVWIEVSWTAQNNSQPRPHHSPRPFSHYAVIRLLPMKIHTPSLQTPRGATFERALLFFQRRFACSTC